MANGESVKQNLVEKIKSTKDNYVWSSRSIAVRGFGKGLRAYRIKHGGRAKTITSLLNLYQVKFLQELNAGLIDKYKEVKK